jgi:hypothetical protein
MSDNYHEVPVVPANAGTQCLSKDAAGSLAFAGTTIFSMRASRNFLILNNIGPAVGTTEEGGL